METRKITIVNTRTQSTKVIETAAETLAELKEALNTENIDYSNMTFYEGLSQVELLNDATILPHDVMYKGTQTNDLVIMLTNMRSKITSGAPEIDYETLLNDLTDFLKSVQDEYTTDTSDDHHCDEEDEEVEEDDEEVEEEYEEETEEYEDDEDECEEDEEPINVDPTKQFTVEKLYEVKNILEEIIARNNSAMEVDKSAYTQSELDDMQHALNL